MIILIVAKRAAAEWLLIFSNVMKKSVHTLISFVFRPAKAHRAFAGRLYLLQGSPFLCHPEHGT